MKNQARTIAVVIAVAAGLTVTAAPAQAATVVGSSFAKCNPTNNTHDPITQIRLEQTFYRTAGPTGKILAYKATPTVKIVRTGPDIEMRFIRIELHRPGNATIVTTRNPGQFGSTGAPIGRAATTTYAVYHIYAGGQYHQSVKCGIYTPAI